MPGNTWDIPEHLTDELEEFACAMYGRASKTSKVDQLRLMCINKLCAKEDGYTPSECLPPSTRTLIQHIRRVNHQIGFWKMSDITEPNIPTPGKQITGLGLEPPPPPPTAGHVFGMKGRHFANNSQV